MRRLALLAPVFLTVLLSLAWGQAEQVEVVVNQTGRIPVTGIRTVNFKFAIVLEESAVPATAVATVSGAKVTGLSLGSGGFGYTTPPTVTITGGGGGGAKATASVSHGMVTALNLTAAGAGYTGVPVVTLSVPPAGLKTVSLWSNDGTSVAGSQPVHAVPIQAAAGYFSALLGYTGLPHMAALPRSVLAYLDARVLVWYAVGGSPYRTLFATPLLSVPYAEQASYAALAGGVPDGSITGNSLAPGSITAAQLAPGAITADKLAPAVLSPSGSLLGSLSASDAKLGAQGYSRLQSLPGGDWSVSTASGVPSPRQGHSAIWTGSALIVWGGTVGSSLSNQGGEYTLATKSWSALPTNNAPAARSGHTAVWTNSQMLVWGGATSANPGGEPSGGIFSEARQAWRDMASASAPSGRVQHTAVWTGDRLIVWGGGSPFGVCADGGAFVPPLDTAPPSDLGVWTPLPASAVVGARRNHSAIWTGSKMIVWGGLDASASPLNTGASFDPTDGSWTALPTLNAPSARFGHAAVWTGGQMVVFGGRDTELADARFFNDGAVYDPIANTWTPLPSAGAPEARVRSGAVWTGSEMLVFSGQGASGDLLSAGAFNPATSAWRALPSAPSSSTQLAGIWSGTALLTFGLGGLDVLDPSPTVYLYGHF